MVTPELRRNAKAVNFGIVYGLSPFGLAAQLGIPQSEAQRYIQDYFARYAGVRRFIDRQIEEVRRTGETRTLFGRARPIPDINGRNPNARGFAERTAVNTPLQGTAADLLKLAMIRIDAELQSRRLETAMLLAGPRRAGLRGPPEELDEVKRLVKHEMENATAWKCRWRSTSASAPTGATRSRAVLWTGNPTMAQRRRARQPQSISPALHQNGELVFVSDLYPTAPNRPAYPAPACPCLSRRTRRRRRRGKSSQPFIESNTAAVPAPAAPVPSAVPAMEKRTPSTALRRCRTQSEHRFPGDRDS